MLTLRPYSIPMNPSRKQILGLLGKEGFLIGDEKIEFEDGKIITLKRWAKEKPEFESIEKQQEFAIIRVFIHYIEENPETDLSENNKTTENWQPLRLSRIVTLWIPLKNNDYDFLLSVGNMYEEDIRNLFTNLLPEVNPNKIQGKLFDFVKVREQNKEGWLHGCVQRPLEIQKGTFYGDFDFEDKESELKRYKYLDNPNGTKSNQVGIILSDENERRKVRVLKKGKFQLMGIPKEKFYGGLERKKVIEECFKTGAILLKATF